MKKLTSADLYYEFSKYYNNLKKKPNFDYYDNIGSEQIYVHNGIKELFIDTDNGVYEVYYNDYGDVYDKHFSIKRLKSLFKVIENVFNIIEND